MGMRTILLLDGGDARIEWTTWHESDRQVGNLFVTFGPNELGIYGRRDRILALIQSIEASILENDPDVTVVFDGEAPDKEPF